MKTIRLGKTGLEVSRIGMGGIPLTRQVESEAVKVVQHALDLGVNFIDTARGYGISEERIGKAIAGRREHVILATKGGAMDKTTALESLEESLKQLNTDYIDLWQVHGINTFEKLDIVIGPGGHLEGAREALRAGKIRHIGFSSHSLKVALKAVASGQFETIQFPFNFVSDEAVNELMPLARSHNLGFIAMKPFAGGRIKDANLAIKYLLQFPTILPDPGIEKAEEIEEIVNIINNGDDELTAREQWEIEEIRGRIGTRFCRQCQYCMPCPQDVHICGALYLKILWELWPPELYFVEYSVGGYVSNAINSAENCLQCGECETKCPYQPPIREMIAENIEFYNRIATEHRV